MAEMKTLTIDGVTYDIVDANAVSTNEQSLADERKAQARANIEAPADADLEVVRHRAKEPLESFSLADGESVLSASQTATSQFQPTASNINISESEFTSGNYGFIVGYSAGEVETNNVTIKHNVISSVKGNRSRKNVNGANENIVYFNNDCETTGETDDSVGIEVWTGNSKVLFNNIHKGTQTGHSGVTAAGGKHVVVGNTIKGFAAGLEVVSDLSVVAGNIVDGATDGIYLGSPLVDNAMFSDNVFYGGTCGIKNHGGVKYLDVNNCKFIRDETSDSRGVWLQQGSRSDDDLPAVVRFNGCHWHNFGDFVSNAGDDKIMWEFNNCLFTHDNPRYTHFNVGVTLRGCTFANGGVGVGSGKAIIDACKFANYSAVLYGSPIIKSSGSNPLFYISNCKFDSPDDGIKVFSIAPSAEYQQYNGGFLDGVFVTFNKSAEAIPELANLKSMVGSKPCFVYDSYLRATYIWVNGTLNKMF